MASLSAADRKIVTVGGIFFSNLIKVGACVEDVAQVIAALCRDNEEFSTTVAKTIVSGLESGMAAARHTRDHTHTHTHTHTNCPAAVLLLCHMLFCALREWCARVSRYALSWKIRHRCRCFK